MRLLPLALLLALELPAQATTSRIIVTDSIGNRVPFAWVQVGSGVARTTDDSGRAVFETPPQDSLRVTARRMGYLPFSAFVARDTLAGAYPVRLVSKATSVDRVTILVPGDLRLVKNGFYARMEDAVKLPTSSRFLGPEELDLRNASRTSSLLALAGWFRMERKYGKTFVLGRGGCAVNFILDGRRPPGMVEEAITTDGRQRITQSARQSGISEEAVISNWVLQSLSVDELVSPNVIAAIEMYANGNMAPEELKAQVREYTCGVVAIWTGRRQ